VSRTDPHQSARSDVERNRRVLLDAAGGALSRNPGASMAEIAREANLTRATLYRHFGSRERLIGAMRAEALVRARETIAGCRLDEGTALEALRRVVDAIVAQGARFGFLLAEGAEQDPDFTQERDRVFAPLRDVVRRGQAGGQVRTDLSAEWIVAAVVSLLTAGVRAAGSLPAGGSPEEDLVFRTLVEGVGAPGLTAGDR
jgi:TetR/AcrR family transcriptional regulator, mexCD-oprJ operon repressor